jgi:hypothetical protein
VRRLLRFEVNQVFTRLGSPPACYNPRVIIDKTREPSLQINEGEPFAIDSAEVQRDVEHSTLTNVLRDGAPVTFSAGDKVTMWTGPNVVFMGKAIDEHSVLDLLSTEVDDMPDDYESI